MDSLVRFLGLLYLAIPDDLVASEYARWLSCPVMVLVGIPLYICACAGTPTAAALVAKGFSPGAALIFLRSVYAGSVIAVTVAPAPAIIVDMLR